MDTKYKILTEEILESARIRINGSNHCNIQVHNYKFYKKAITEGEPGPGKSKMDGWLG